MSKYGEYIDSGVDLSKVNVYNLFTNYFNNPLMSKIKSVDGFTMYGCRINSLLSKDRKYIIVLVKGINNNEVRLDELEWDFLQTRCLEEVYQVPIHSYPQKKEDTIIKIHKKTDTKYMYHVENLPIVVSLLFGKNQVRIYNDRGTLGLALENYNTIISFL